MRLILTLFIYKQASNLCYNVYISISLYEISTDSFCKILQFFFVFFFLNPITFLQKSFSLPIYLIG